MCAYTCRKLTYAEKTKKQQQQPQTRMAACILKQNLQVVFCHSKWRSLQPFTCSHTLGKDSGGKDPVVHVNVWWIKKTPA